MSKVFAAFWSAAVMACWLVPVFALTLTPWKQVPRPSHWKHQFSVAVLFARRSPSWSQPKVLVRTEVRRGGEIAGAGGDAEKSEFDEFGGVEGDLGREVIFAGKRCEVKDQRTEDPIFYRSCFTKHSVG